MKKKEDVGVVVGRFQVDDLHEGHRELLQEVDNRHNRLIIFIGISPCKCTFNNPLDFALRRSLLQEYFPEATVLYIKDVRNDVEWSEDLDSKIETLIGPGQTCRLYGSRDSFIPYYHGKYPTEELKQKVFISGTILRKRLASKVKNTRDFRAGAIWAMQNQWPAPKVTIDVGIFNTDFSCILLGRKKKEKEYRLIGGFVGNGETFEETVLREAKEETSLSLTHPEYLGSFPVDDWRYRAERDKITTVLFLAQIKAGKPYPGDDIFELRWFDFNDALVDEVVYEHRPLIQALYTFLSK